MLSQEQIDQFQALFSQSSAFIKAYLEHQQQEIEKETGIKPSMQELFEELRGKIDDALGLAPKKKSTLFPIGLPGIRIEEVFGFFIPDLTLLSQIPNWHVGFFPEEMDESERSNLIKLYFDSRFQRLSSTFPGRLSIIAANEGISEADLRESVGLPREPFLFSQFCHDGSDEELEKVLDKLEDLYDEKYGLDWIACNEPPTGKALQQLKWLSGIASCELWWKEARETIALHHRISELKNYPVGPVEKKMNWMYSQPKFKKLSSTIHGRMDIICRIELMSREQMAEELGLELDVLDHPEQHAVRIIQHLIGRFGDDYGAIWLAYGLCGLEREFAWQALKDDHAFLRRVPALFRKAGRSYISYAAATGELSGVEDGRECKNCGGPLKGRIDKQFCCGACQRIYYYRMRNQGELNDVEDENDEHEVEEEKLKDKSQLAEFLEGPIGQVVTGAVKALVDRGVNKLGDQLFGVPGTEGKKPEEPDKK